MTDLIERLKAEGVEACDDGTYEHKWLYINPPCETCGDHDGLMCDVCCEVLHQPDNPQLYEAIVQHYRIKESP